MAKAHSVVRSLPYPAVEVGNFSFSEGVYEVTARKKAMNRVALRHELRGAPFVENLVRKGEAKFACLVSVPKTGYRRMEMAEGPEQEIGWDLDVAGEPPILGPLVLYVGDDFHHRLTARDGVAAIWHGRKVVIPRGARLARERYLRPSAAIQNLLKVRLDGDMAAGSFVVRENSNDGFYFMLEAAPDVFRFLQNSQGEERLRGSILTHAVSQCFNILQRDYEEDGQWEQHRNLVSLAEWLEGKGEKHWSDDDFDGALAATRIYSLRVPKDVVDEEEE